MFAFTSEESKGEALMLRDAKRDQVRSGRLKHPLAEKSKKKQLAFRPSPSGMALSDTVLHFSGHQHLRHRLVLSILSGKPVRIDKIRSDDKDPGLRGAQFSLSAITYVSDTGPSGRL